ncbi:MAG: amino acid permease [Aureliella sp.]
MWSKLFRRKDASAIRAEMLEVELSDVHQLAKHLNLFDLVCFGIAAVVGAGIFSTIGTAAAEGGPAVTVLFVITAITCLFSALCYAEFAARIPVSGSAYTYSYAAFGELIAWIIGWDLLMEYSIGNSVIAFSWSEYFSALLHGMRWDIPDWLETDYYSCARAVEAFAAKAQSFDLRTLLDAQRELNAAHWQGATPAELQSLPAYATVQSAKDAGLDPDKLLTWQDAPQLSGLRAIVDVPALAINLLVTCLVYIGIKESKTASNAMVILKIAVVLAVIAVGLFYVTPSNWSPFAPNGISGVLKGIAAVFFAYIGFDAISTTAEECKQPQRDLPRATVLTLVICTLLYVAIALVLTGMVPYRELAVGDPLAIVFQKHNLDWIAGIISLSAIVAITSVFLVFQIGQPRIWMSMARDGLLPPSFARIHPTFKTPSFATVVTGIVVALPILFLNQALVTDLCSIGTLFAFMLVSAGVLMMEYHRSHDHNTEDPNAEDDNSGGDKKHFRVPYINGRWFVPAICIAYTIGMFGGLPPSHNVFVDLSAAKFPYVAFYILLCGMTVFTFMRQLSLIPVLGVLSNLYLIAGLGHHNWMRFLLWCIIGLAIYFGYGYWHSRLNR